MHIHIFSHLSVPPNKQIITLTISLLNTMTQSGPCGTQSTVRDARKDSCDLVPWMSASGSRGRPGHLRGRLRWVSPSGLCCNLALSSWAGIWKYHRTADQQHWKFCLPPTWTLYQFGGVTLSQGDFPPQRTLALSGAMSGCHRKGPWPSVCHWCPVGAGQGRH